MKKLFLALLAFSFSPALATYFTFTGIVTSVYTSDEFSSLRGYVGSPVEYVYFADFAITPYYIKGPLGDTNWVTSQPGFYSELVSGPTILPEFGYQNDPSGVIEGHVGLYRTGELKLWGETEFNSRINGHYRHIFMNAWSPGVTLSGIGSIADGSEISYYEYDKALMVNTSLTLTGISESNPMVPEPKTFALFGLGSLAFFFVTAKRKSMIKISQAK
ncbi:MAG: hypothetical protein JWP91_405 [Fibrobacteres bacterium]|nr:hypothetical protein [Fibrobacterota bacterium]